MLVDVELDVVVRVGRRFHQVPETGHIARQIGRAVHRHQRAAAAGEQVAILRDEACLDEHEFRFDVVDLPRLLLGTVAEVAEHDGRCLFVDRREVQQAEIVVLQDQQHLVACAETERMAHHVGDPIGETVILGKGVASVALDVHDGKVVPEAQRHGRHDAAEIHLHASPPWRFPPTRVLPAASDELVGVATTIAFQ